MLKVLRTHYRAAAPGNGCGETHATYRTPMAAARFVVAGRRAPRAACGMVRITLAALALLVTPALAQTPPPAPNTMSRAALAEEVTRLRALESNGAVTLKRPDGCTSAESRQFDFWLGEWDVSNPGSSDLVAESSITLADQGCVIIEEWRPFQGPSGHSINFYDATDQRWHQAWADATPRRAEYRGALENGVLVFEQLASNPQARMSFQALDANTVRQWGERLDPATGAWNVTWDLTYRRRAGTR